MKQSPANQPSAEGVQEARRIRPGLVADNLGIVRNGRSIFAGLSFAVAPGEILAVRGPNGAGKSTLLRIVAGLLTPSTGRVGIHPNHQSEVAPEAHYLGHLDGLKTALTVNANLEFWRRVWDGAGTVAPALDAVGLGDLAGLPAGVLSAGQRRRLALSRLLIAPRPLWLLDEPQTALDQPGEAILGRLLERHTAGGGMALVATHRDLPVTPTSTLTLGRA